MLVTGDARRTEETTAALRRLRSRAERLRAPLAPRERRSLLTTLLLDSGEVAQGILDALFAGAGSRDAAPRAVTHAGRLLFDVACVCHRAWVHGGLTYEVPGTSALDALEAEPLPETISVSVPDGFAHDAVLPELYFAAGERFRAEHGSSLRVIGVRSIGTSLAACVAAASGAPRPAVTVRPVGHRFDRRLSVAPDLTDQILGGEEWYGVVDDGPGLSGSSFLSVADWLVYRGVPRERIVFFPSHAGDPGGRGGAVRVARWRAARRFHVPFEELMLGDLPSAPLARLFEPETGEATSLEDLGAGRWRRLVFPSSGVWPPVDPRGERRKYLLTRGRRRWVAEFLGLGRYGEEKLERARVLHRAGVAPAPVALRNGFLLREWVEGTPLAPGPVSAPLLDALAHYLSVLWFRFPTTDGEGADPKALLDMAIHNAGEGLNHEIARELFAFQDRTEDLARRARPVKTDNRMRPVEWIAAADGRFLKMDGLHHHAGRDLVGAQDLTWDVAGTVLEFNLDEERRDGLLRMLQNRTGWRPTEEQLAFYLRCYAAFRLGEDSVAAQSLWQTDPDEASRLHSSARRWALALRKLLLSPVESVRRISRQTHPGLRHLRSLAAS